MKIIFFLAFCMSFCFSTSLYAQRGATEAQKNQFIKAEESFKQALSADPYNLTAVYNLAGVYAFNKKEVEAKKLLEKYLAQQPNNPDLHARLGDIYFSLKNTDSALSQYKKTLDLNPDYRGIYAKMSSIYLMKNNTKDAEVALRIAIKEAPKNANLQRNFSAVLLANGKKEEAIAVAKKALQLESSADAYITLGTAYEMSKDNKNALIAYKRAYDLGNKSLELKNKIDELENLD